MNLDSMQWWWSEWSVETTSSKQISKPLLSFICIFKVLHDSSQESQIRLGPPLAWRSDRLPTRRLGGKIKSTILLRYPRRSILTLTLAATPQREFRNGRSPRMSTSARTCRFGYHSPQERWLVRLRWPVRIQSSWFELRCSRSGCSIKVTCRIALFSSRNTVDYGHEDGGISLFVHFVTFPVTVSFSSVFLLWESWKHALQRCCGQAHSTSFPYSLISELVT